MALFSGADREYRPGETVSRSGIYRVTHDKDHLQPHEVTVIQGRRFPPCNHCGQHPRFVLVKAAMHIDDHPNLK